jgi:hypothetical protein
MEWSNEDIFKFIEQHDLFHKPSRTYPSKAAGPPFAELRRVVQPDCLFCSDLLAEQMTSRHSTSSEPTNPGLRGTIRVIRISLEQALA